MEDNRINDLMETTVEKIRQLTDTNTIIGSPIFQIRVFIGTTAILFVLCIISLHCLSTKKA